MAIHHLPPGAGPANPAPMPPIPPRDLRRVPDEIERMAYPDDDRELTGWPEHMLDQRNISANRSCCEDEENDDGF